MGCGSWENFTAGRISQTEYRTYRGRNRPSWTGAERGEGQSGGRQGRCGTEKGKHSGNRKNDSGIPYDPDRYGRETERGYRFQRNAFRKAEELFYGKRRNVKADERTWQGSVSFEQPEGKAGKFYRIPD